jgi:hypothetical protein
MLRSWQCTPNQATPLLFRLFPGIAVPGLFDQGFELGASPNQVTIRYKEES